MVNAYLLQLFIMFVPGKAGIYLCNLGKFPTALFSFLHQSKKDVCQRLSLRSLTISIREADFQGMAIEALLGPVSLQGPSRYKSILPLK